MAASTPSAVPDVLEPGLACVFCGINPGRVSAAAAAHFANPRNDFWRLLHDAGFTPRLYAPEEQFALAGLGYGLTNAAYRTTPGSGDLRRGDFDRGGFEERIRAVAPRVVAFVGKEAFRGLWNERPELGPQLRSVGSTALFVLPSTSPANAAVPYAERLRWFRELRAWIEPEDREAVRALVVDAEGRVLLTRFGHPVTRDAWWATVGGGVDPGESDEEALRRELREEAGLAGFELGPLVHTREHTFPWAGRLLRQRERFYLVRVQAHEPAPTIDLAAEGVTDVRWWTRAELDDPPETVVPANLGALVRGAAA
ncbi:MAG TPA: NUDIX domain-containing protein [Gaiellaceae bacterium]